MSEEQNRQVALIVALKAEARPLIKKLGLKRLEDRSVQCYISENTKLMISGAGRKNAARAIAWIMRQKQPPAICNVGICGSRNKDLKIGTAVYINKVHDNMTGITYYPDPITRHRFDESGIVTHDEAQVCDSINLWNDAPLVDMEAASICSEAKTLIDWHNLHIIKIVSDHLEGMLLKKDFVESIINNCCDEIIGYIKNIQDVYAKEPVIKKVALKKILGVETNLRLSSTQKKKFKRICLHKISNGDCDLTSLDNLHEICNLFINNRNKTFTALCRELIP